MTEARVPVVGYEEFSLKVHSQSMTRRIPMAGSMELTFRCNFRCIHCYCVDEQIPNELSLDEIRGLLDQMADEGCLWVLLTGGEPLLRRDFLDIYRYARGKGMIVTVFTNGSLITEAVAEELGSLKPFVVEITLYGATPETYKAVTGKAEHFQRVVDGVERLLRRGVPLKVKTMLLRQNVHELPALRRLAESWGLKYRFDPVINPTLSKSMDPLQCMLSPEEIVALDTSDPERMKGWEEFCGRFIGSGSTGLLYRCGAGQWGFNIGPDGKFTLCAFARQDSFDLRKGSFKEAFHEFLPRVLSQKITRTTKCTSCNLVDLCGQCPGQAYLCNGDQEEPVEYLCRVAHARAKAFGISTAAAAR